MDHGVGNFHTGGKPVEDQPSYLGFQNSNEISELVQVLFCAVNRGREMAFERTGDLQDLLPAGVAHKQRGRPEDLGVEIGTQKRVGIGLEHSRVRRESCRVGSPLLRQHRHRRIGLPLCNR